MKKILIADDEDRMRRLISDFLKKEGFEVLEAADGLEAIDLFQKEKGIDLVILDVMMPGSDGWSVCRAIRAESSVSIIMLTARGEESDELFGFDLGADEYIKKPFSPKIVIARVKSLLKRGAATASDVINIGGIELRDDSHEVSIDDKRIELSPKEYSLLKYLMDNKGICLNRDQILNAVWDYSYLGESRTVDTHIKTLRIKLGVKSELLETVRGFGYRLVDK